ncbi:MAG: hypothetical protein ACREKH_22005 [Candidatus Rokuibacteriota bacterium]
MSSEPPAQGSANEQIAAHARAADLVGLPWPDRLRVVREDRSLAVPSFIELAIGLARNVGLTYAEREEWARLGVEAARQGLSKRAQELEALAWASLGNSRRLRGNLAASRVAFMRTRALRRHVVDPLELAATYDLEAAYWQETLELTKALELNAEASRRGVSRRAVELEPFAWAMLGNVSRLRGRLRASRAALLRCQALRHRLVDPLDLAECCSVEAAYWSDLGGYAGAAHLLGDRFDGQSWHTSRPEHCASSRGPVCRTHLGSD